MKSKIFGLVIGVFVLGGLMINTLLEAPVVTDIVTEKATTTVNNESASSTIHEIKIENKQVQTSVKVQEAPKPAPLPSPEVKAEPAKKTQFTFAEVTVHNNKNDCWSIVNNNVYELTSWISKHPGGEREIIGMCGKDATSKFDNQHGGDSKPEKILVSYYIGTLIN